ncbi:hypothetical protein JCM30204_05190 [Dysgonomonas termitidis]
MIQKKLYKRSGSALSGLGVYCLLTLAMAFTSCRNEESVEINGAGKQVTITMSVPGATAAAGPVTYAMPADEAKVNTVDVLCFQTDPGYPTDVDRGTFLYRATVGYTAGASTFSVILAEQAENQTLVVLANCRTQVESLLSTISRGDTKASVISSLVLSQSTAFDASTMTGIPMWGEITNQDVTASYAPVGLQVFLTRMLARINITNTEADFVLQEAYLYNPRQKGSMIPDNWNSVQKIVNAPTVVAGAEMPRGTTFGPFTTSATNKIENKIFTFEADNIAKAGADPLDATCLVVGGLYKGTTSYYRVEMKDYGGDNFIDVKRNYTYNVTLDGIDFEGAGQPADAYTGRAMIKATVEAWNDRHAMVTAGNNHLKVSTNVLSFPSSVGNDIIDVFTDHPDGWVIDKIEGPSGETIDWLTATPDNGAANVTQPLTIDVLEAGLVNRSAFIHLKADNMTVVITVNQLRKETLTLSKNIDAAGSFNDISGLYNSNEEVQLPATSDNDGYVWDGWYNTSSGQKVAGDPRQPVISLTNGYNHEYQARWIEIPTIKQGTKLGTGDGHLLFNGEEGPYYPYDGETIIVTGTGKCINDASFVFTGTGSVNVQAYCPLNHITAVLAEGTYNSEGCQNAGGMTSPGNHTGNDDYIVNASEAHEAWISPLVKNGATPNWYGYIFYIGNVDNGRYDHYDASNGLQYVKYGFTIYSSPRNNASLGYTSLRKCILNLIYN